MLAWSAQLLLPPPLPSPTLAEGLVVLHVVLLPGLASHSLLLQTTHCRLPMKTRLQRRGREREMSPSQLDLHIRTCTHCLSEHILTSVAFSFCF